MVSSESALFQVVYEYRIRIAPESNILEVENSLINTAPYERLLGVWSITRLDSFPLKRVLLPEGKRSSSAELHVAKHGSAVGLIRAKNEIELRVDIQEETPEDFFELRTWCKNTVIQAEAEKEFEGKGYGDFKLAVGETVADALAPIQAEQKRLLADKAYLGEILARGVQNAAYTARKTLSKVQRKIGLYRGE